MPDELANTIINGYAVEKEENDRLTELRLREAYERKERNQKEWDKKIQENDFNILLEFDSEKEDEIDKLIFGDDIQENDYNILLEFDVERDDEIDKLIFGDDMQEDE